MAGKLFSSKSYVVCHNRDHTPAKLHKSSASLFNCVMWLNLFSAPCASLAAGGGF